MNNFHVALNKLIYNEGQGTNFDEQLNKNIQIVSSLFKSNNHSKFLTLKHPFNDSIRWKYISLAFDILLSLENNETIISINYINDIKEIFQFIISLGILPNLIPGIRLKIEKRKNINKIPIESLSVQEQYYRLTRTVKGLLLCLKIQSLRNFILANHFNDLLAGLLQLTFAPIKKPTNVKNTAEFQMTDKFYNEIISENCFFTEELNLVLSESYTPQVIKELMFFYGNITSPKWLKSSVYKILVSKLLLYNGVESLIKALCGTNLNDTGAKWKQYDILVKIVLTKPVNFKEDIYYTNICSQIFELLTKTERNDQTLIHYELIVSICIKYLYEKNKELCYKHFLTKITQSLTQFANNNMHVNENKIITQDIFKTINLCYNCIIQSSGMVQPLPINCITPIINILYRIYIALHHSMNFKDLTKKINNILVKYLNETDNKNEVFESLLFNKNHPEILLLQEHLEIIINNNNDIEIISNATKIRISPLKNSDCFLEIIKNSKLIVPCCIYLLEISVIQDTNTNLLHLENEDVLVLAESVKCKIVAYNILSKIIKDSKVHTHLQTHPENMFKFIETTLNDFILNKLHRSANCDSEQYQLMFILIMIVSIISKNKNLNNYSNLKNLLNLIYNETPNSEIKNLITKILNAKELQKCNTPKNEFEKALEDICDPLLPVRGHGLMILAKLLEEKNPDACSQKQYILNLCQQHIKNEDSYIYLNAIKVLATLGNTFPDIIINILTEEYSNGSKDLFENNNETRMKLGEVLLRVVKNLGETAPKYKSILLNTFLTGIRDEDHLIRASSLSILGEICRVLGYKLGSVVNEVLSSIHAVIATDKAVEARRAAVSVIRWLFVGLEKETIMFLKDDILPIYKTLKVIYTSDPDDITRLQAQLALEQLNENVRDFIFPKVQLEKNNIMLK